MGLSSAQFINYLLFVVLLLMFTRTFKQAKSLGNGKGYMDAYTKILNGDLDSEENLDKYIESEKKAYLISQAYLLKAYLNVESENDPKQYLDKVDMNAIFNDEKNRFDKKKVLSNVSFFLWVNFFVVRCIKNNRLDLVDYLNDSLKVHEENLDSFLEYRLYKGLYAGVKGNKNDDYNFLNQLIDGEYPTLNYEKRYIGLYKREAALFLVYFDQTIDEFWDNDIHAFVDTIVGKRLSSDLDLYLKYHIEEKQEAIPSDEEEEDK